MTIVRDTHVKDKKESRGEELSHVYKWNEDIIFDSERQCS